MKLCLIFIVIGFLPLKSFAQGEIDHIKNQPYMKNAAIVNCDVDDDGYTTITSRICANLAFQKSDSLLVIVYIKLLSREETDSGRKYIKNLQKEWRSFRAKHCKIVWNKYSGGSIQAASYLSCLTELTNNRSKELESLLDE